VTIDDHAGAIVVGVDGSLEALNAVRWAVAEAVHRDLTLRLVHAVPVRHGTTRDGDSDCDSVLSDAEDAATQIKESVRVQMAEIPGRPGDVLICESRRASMVCIGSREPRRAASRLIGATAAALAEHARCPVAIIRTGDDGCARTDGVVAVVLSDECDNDDVVHRAMHEGRLRGATVRQIDRRVDSWIRRYPDVRVETVAAGTGGQYGRCESRNPEVGLAVVGSSDAGKIATLSTPNCHPIVGYPDCSVLLVRH
jgi:nucleotide-binding universal stress UspA family protein